MQTYTNTGAVPLSLAVFLASDSYDHDSATISATTLMKPLRQIVLGARVKQEDSSVDLINLVQSRMGSAIHDAIERSWTDNYAQALGLLGYPKKVIERVCINPTPEELTEDCIPIYLERRAYKQVGKHRVSGKFDFVGDGRVEDFKTTGVYSYTARNNDDKYILQGSIYRWLNPAIITKDEMAIQFIFTDWQAVKARTDPNYPQQRALQRIFMLKSFADTEHYVTRKLTLIDQYWDADEASIPQCSDEDLWRSEPVFKYYKNPLKTTRSTKNFDTFQEARIRQVEDGSVGVIKESPGRVMACRYCSAFSECSQKDALIASGDLTL